jgi:type IV pilus assembly protein PilW
MKMDISSKIKLITSKRMNATGFTLVELMIALFISGLVMAAVVSIYIAQSKAYSSSDDIASIQQNLRGALAIMPMEIRLAGCDPTESAVPKILAATRANFRFTMDTKNNANPRRNIPDGAINGDEDIAYGFGAVVDNNSDGIVDNGGANWSGAASLGRQIANAGGFQPLADNIEALEFNYILDDGTTSLAPANLNRIRAVQISLLARTANPSPDFLHTGTYTTASGAVWTPPQDRFRRRLVMTTIQCRNMGY